MLACPDRSMSDSSISRTCVHVQLHVMGMHLMHAQPAAYIHSQLHGRAAVSIHASSLDPHVLHARMVTAA